MTINPPTTTPPTAKAVTLLGLDDQFWPNWARAKPRMINTARSRAPCVTQWCPAAFIHARDRVLVRLFNDDQQSVEDACKP